MMDTTEKNRRLIDQTRTYYVSTKVRGYEHDAYRDDPGWQGAMQGAASRSLADAIITDAGKLQVIEPSKEQLEVDPSAAVEYQWTVRVVMPGELFDYFGKQMAEARAEAKAEIIGKVRDLVDDALAKADNFRGVQLLMRHWLAEL